MAPLIVRGMTAALLLGGSACTGSHSGAGRSTTGNRVQHELRFRQVIAVESGSTKVPEQAAGPPCRTVNTTVSGACATAAVQAQIAKLGDCAHPVPLTEPSSADDPGQPAAACDHADGHIYLLAPGSMTGLDIKKATSVDDATQGWLIQLVFTGKGSADFGTLTGAVTSLAPPLNRVAMVLDGVVLSAPTIAQAITGGEAQITGGSDGFSQADTDRLAKALNQASIG